MPDRGELPIAVLLLAVAALFAGAALWLRTSDATELLTPVLLAVAVVLAWIGTRPWHPVLAPLYRHRLQAAWEEWAEAVERWQARDDRKGAYEAQRATDDLVTRLAALRPPAARAPITRACARRPPSTRPRCARGTAPRTTPRPPHGSRRRTTRSADGLPHVVRAFSADPLRSACEL